MAKQTAETSKKSTKADIGGTLKKIGKFWNKAKAKAAESANGDYPEFDDGRYIARLVDIQIGKSQSSNRDQADFSFKFVEGEYAGKIKHNYQGLETEQNLEFFLKDLARLGYDIEELDIDDLKTVIKEITKEKPYVQIVLKTKGGGDYQNVYINRLLDADDVEDESEEDEDDEDAKPAKKKPVKKSKKVDEDEEEEDDDAGDEEEEDDDEDSGDEEESDDDDEEDDDEEEEKPAKKSSKKPAAKPAKKSKKDDDEEEEEDDEEEDDDSGDDEDDEEEEQIRVAVGSEVIVDTKKGKKKGTIIKIFAEDNAVSVKLEDGTKLRLDADRIVSVVEKSAKKAKK